MSFAILEGVKRRIAVAVVALVLLILATALGTIALGAFAFALHHHFRPAFGPEGGWWISGGIFVALSILVLLILYWRLKRSGRTATPTGSGSSPDAALQLAAVLKNELSRNAGTATVLALIVGVAVGLKPEILQSLRRGPSHNNEGT